MDVSPQPAKVPYVENQRQNATKRVDAYAVRVLQYTTQLLLADVAKRMDDVQYENYNVPTLMHGERKLKMFYENGSSSVIVGQREFTEDDYVDARVERVFDVPEVTLRAINDDMQVSRLAKINALLQQLISGSAVTTQNMKSVLTAEQFAEYVHDLDSVKNDIESLYGAGIPEQLHSYSKFLKAADFQQAKYDKMYDMYNAGRAKYKQKTLANALDKAESLYEIALERLEEIWGCANPAELFELQTWMDRHIDFDKGTDRTIGIDVATIPRVKGSKSSWAHDAGLPKLSKRLKRQECQLQALREAAWDLAFEPMSANNVCNAANTVQLKNMLQKLKLGKNLL